MGHRQENSDISGKSTPASAHVKARLKWFNAPKGFGFVNPEDRKNVDAFLHITTLQEAGVQTIGEGACLLCEIEYGDKGAHVKKILNITEAGNLPEELPCSGSIKYEDIAQAQELKGTVKWYKPEDAFGFITADDGLKDIFIHKTCLDRHDIESLETGQRLLMTFRNVPKGREVSSFEIIEDD